MVRNLLLLVVFLLGLAAVGWVGAGYVGSNPLGAAVAALIGVCYLAGAWELYRYRRATHTLDRAVRELDEGAPGLASWLQRLHPSLRNAVRLRVEGERVALPAPTLTPYLVGLLVLLGMLGTLLGMMATLRGTGIALESATDLQAIRGSLAAPVKGLGFAFGTSIAGVASSAMLGLLSALCRRDRLDVVQELDVNIATRLRVHSQAHQREESFRLLKDQANLMPMLIERMESMMAALEQQSRTSGERLIANQESFHATTEVIYTRLASSVEQSMKKGIAESARIASDVLQPVAESTMAALARETASLHEKVSQVVGRQFDELADGWKQTGTAVTAAWNDALAEQRKTNERLTEDVGRSLEAFASRFDERSASLVDHLATRLDTSANHAASAWNDALTRQSAANDDLAERQQSALASVTAAWEAQAASLADAMRRSQLELQQALATRDEDRLKAWADTLAATTATLTQQWERAGDHAASRQQAIGDALERTAQEIATQTQAHASATIAEISRLVDTASEAPKAAADVIAGLNQSQATLQQALATRDDERLKAWTNTLAATTAALTQQWERAGEHATSRQQAIVDTLERTAQDIAAHTQSHASATIAEMSRLVDAASEAPKAAAEVIAELRQKLSDSMVRDTAMLEERTRLLETLETLLDAVNHASTEQRTAVDALIGTSADLLERVGTRFTDHVEAETGKLGVVAEQLTASAAGVASLGEAFGGAVQQFGQSNEALMERLREIAEALDKSLVRSDDQLAYYVAQAREVVDLSVLSQKQIIEDMQHLAERRANGKARA